jgi:hypothetical protein
MNLYTFSDAAALAAAEKKIAKLAPRANTGSLLQLAAGNACGRV